MVEAAGVERASTDNVNARGVSWRRTERPIAGHQRGVQRLGEGDVYRVIRGQVAAQLPRPVDQIEMLVPDNAEGGIVLDRLFGPLGGQLAGKDEPPQGADHLDIHEMRCVEFVIRGEDAPLNPSSCVSLKQEFSHG